MKLLKRIFAVMFIITTILGCKKSETEKSHANSDVVNMYDDPLASPMTQMERIVATGDRMIITYAHGNSNYHPEQIKVQILIVDNDGRLLHHNSLPAGFNLRELILQDDGSFAIVTSMYMFASDAEFNIFHFNRDAEQISSTSVQLPPGSILNNVSGSVNGNILVSAFDNGFNYPLLLECDLSGNILWTKPLNIDIYGSKLFGGFPSFDGGYLFTYNNSFSNIIYVFATNADGDSLWHKEFNLPFYPYCNNIIQNANGNYLLTITNPYFYFNGAPSGLESLYMSVCEINRAGDSIRSAKIDVNQFDYSSAIIKKDDGTTFILVNEFQDNYAPGTNTSYVILDGELNTRDSGLLNGQSINMFDAACKTSDGRTACFGLVQSFDKTYFKPCLIILE